MRNTYIFLLFLLYSFSVAYSQEKILLFDYDEVYPMTSTWADLMEPTQNPAPDAVNNSPVSGLFIHTAQWSEIEIRVEDVTLDARYYNTVELKAFIPANMPDGKVHITCKGLGTSRESRRRYDTYEITPPEKGKWFKIEHIFLGAYPIGLVQIGYRRSEVPNASEDIAYFDDLKFTKTTSNDICLYRESFCIVYPENENANFIANPSQRAGNWVGNVDLTSTGNIVLVKYPNTNSHVMQMLTTGADIVFPGITNLEGYENLRVVFDTRWKIDETKRDAFNSATSETKSPGIKVKSGNGSWINLATQPFTDNWQTQSIVISPSGAQNISLSVGKGNSNFDFEIDNIIVFGTIKASGTKDLSTVDFKFYPNPVKETLYTNQDVEKIEILNLQGELLVSKAGRSISMSNLTSGLYFARAHKDGNVFVHKILKK